jgi:hypothetical protein
VPALLGTRAESASQRGNFNPNYKPWEQRLCMCPESDFYESIRTGKADVNCKPSTKISIPPAMHNFRPVAVTIISGCSSPPDSSGPQLQPQLQTVGAAIVHVPGVRFLRKHSDRQGNKNLNTASNAQLQAGSCDNNIGMQLATRLELNTGLQYHIGENFLWKFAMMDNLPNAVFAFGYTDASWDIGSLQV